MKKLIGLLVVLGVLFVAYPYASLFLIYRSIQKGDEASLERQADWPQLRAHFKADLTAAAAREAEANKGKLRGFAEIISGVIAPVVVDGLVERYVTPQGVISLVRSGGDVSGARPKGDEPPAAPRKGEKVKVTWAFFDAPDRFRVSFEDPKNPGVTGVSLLMALEGACWKITRLKLPIAQLQAAAHKL